jgi:hypothetical protein
MHLDVIVEVFLFLVAEIFIEKEQRIVGFVRMDHPDIQEIQILKMLERTSFGF